MINKNNKNLIFASIIAVLAFVFLLFQIHFINSQELTKITEINSQEFSYYGENAELIDDALVCKTGFEKCKIEIRKGDITTTIEATPGIRISPLGKISVAESGAEFSLNGNKFSNIKSGDIELNMNTGEITRADFFTNENPGNYNINENEFDVKANSRFVYDSKKQEFQLSEGTEIKNIATETKIKTLENEFIKYKGNDINGNLNFDENGNTFVEIGEKIELNGLLIENVGNKLYGSKADLSVFFDRISAESSGKTEYVVADLSENFFAFQEQTTGPKLTNRQILIEFKKDNYLLGDLIDEKDYLLISEGGATPGYLEITRTPGNLPIVKNKGIGDIELWQDGNALNFKENNLFISRLDSYKYPQGKIGTVPMIVETPGKIIEKDGKREEIKGIVGFIPNYDYTGDKPKTFYFTRDEGEVKSLLAGGQYLEADELAEKKYIDNWEKISQVKVRDMEDLVKQANNPQFISSFKASKSADEFLADIYNNKEINLDKVISGKIGSANMPDFRNLQEQLESGKIDQQTFAAELDILKKRIGKEPSVSWSEMENLIGKENSQNIKNAIKTKIKSYYYAGGQGQTHLAKTLGANELSSLNICITSGGNFDNCFDKVYTHYGLLTELCGSNNEYCPVLTVSKFFSIRF